jgi:hypothetical protein
MTQGAPVLAGMTNSASQTTNINMLGSYVGLSVVANSPHVGAANPVWAAIQAAGFDPGAEGVYAIGRRRGVYAVGLDGEGVWAYSWSSDAVRGTTAVSSSAGVVGQHTADGVGVLGESANGIGVHGQTASPEGQNAGVFGESSGYGMGVRGTSAQGVGVMGECQGGVAGVGILGQNSSNNSDGAGVLAIGGLGVGLQASGARAPISLVPNLAITGAPTTGSHSMGN